jgi:hypothetical protein
MLMVTNRWSHSVLGVILTSLFFWFLECAYMATEVLNSRALVAICFEHLLKELATLSRARQEHGK